LSRALRSLLAECAIGWQEADEVHRGAGLEEGLEGTTIRLCDPAGGLLTLERAALPFTPAEFARARALLELEHRIVGRVAAQRAVILLTSGAELAIRQGVRADAAPVATMYRRCGPESRRRRSTPLERLLSRGHGHTFLAEDPAGDVLAANLTWDGDIPYVALLVADSWQRQRIGTALPRRLIAVGADAGTQTARAVTDADNEPMVRTIRNVGALIRSTEPYPVPLASRSTL
jgi:GNAT superfamily N-acetyltransferase